MFAKHCKMLGNYIRSAILQIKQLAELNPHTLKGETIMDPTEQEASSIPPETVQGPNRTNTNLRVLRVQREIAKDVIRLANTRLQEAAAIGQITEKEKAQLVDTYQQQAEIRQVEAMMVDQVNLEMQRLHHEIMSLERAQQADHRDCNKLKDQYIIQMITRNDYLKRRAFHEETIAGIVAQITEKQQKLTALHNEMTQLESKI